MLMLLQRRKKMRAQPSIFLWTKILTVLYIPYKTETQPYLQYCFKDENRNTFIFTNIQYLINKFTKKIIYKFYFYKIKKYLLNLQYNKMPFLHTYRQVNYHQSPLLHCINTYYILCLSLSICISTTTYHVNKITICLLKKSLQYQYEFKHKKTGDVVSLHTYVTCFHTLNTEACRLVLWV